MKKVGVLFFLLFYLSGCNGTPKEIEKGMALRSCILQGKSCSFYSKITADYGDEVLEFSLQCIGTENGDLQFTVLEPESIADITGSIEDNGGELTFDGLALCFETLVEGQISPVSAPWIFLKALRSGYITSACMEGNQLRLTIDDSYEEGALQLDIWLNDENIPKRAEILYDGLRILSLQVDDFVIS